MQHIVLFLQPLLYYPAAFPVHPVAFPVRPTASISKYAACQYLLNIFQAVLVTQYRTSLSNIDRSSKGKMCRLHFEHKST
jgi:hypothetical protein